MPDCIFCKIVKGDIPSFKIWEDSDFLAFLDVRPIKNGHVLIVPKIHIEDVFDFPEELYNKIFLAAKQLVPALKLVTKAKRIGFMVEGFGVPHAHLHLVPLDKGNELNPENAKEISKAELEKIQHLLLEALN